MESIGIDLFIKGEQIQRLNEDKSFDYTKATNFFNYKPKDFEVAIRNEIMIFLKRKKKF